ncbi:MAG TPA: transcription antitermination factor NusB [Thermomicrobiales bacterium]|nr:transcription antitermination factor NusB [Thermomicrobiales bacterium]
MTDSPETTTGDRGRTSDAPLGAVDARHQARILALQLLYEIDLTNHDREATLAHLFDEDAVPPTIQKRVRRLVEGVEANQAEIDPLIVEAAPAYPLVQIPAIDRNVLRLAIYELRHEPDVPPRAAINEAVELAKRFGGDHSARFVNGVLGTIFEQMPERSQTAPRRRPRPKGRDASAT